MNTAVKNIPFNYDKFEKSGKTFKISTKSGSQVRNVNAYLEKGKAVILCEINGEIVKTDYNGRAEGFQMLYMSVPIEFYNTNSCVVYGAFNPDMVESKVIDTTEVSKFVSELEIGGFTIFHIYNLKNI